MNNRFTYLILLLSFLFYGMLFSQTVPENAGRLENGKFILKINLSWNEEQQAQLAGLFELDSLTIVSIFGENLQQLADSTEWEAISIQPGVIEISKKVGIQPSTINWFQDVILSDLPFKDKPGYPDVYQIIYGVNDFRKDVFNYSKGKGCFRLPGNQDAYSVILSGSFNNWSTLQRPMQRTNEGWTTCIDPPYGPHYYKYIVDGRWMPDPNNKQTKYDGHGGNNSVLYIYNYVFKLKGNVNARRVYVSGSFNEWNTRELRMQETSWGWILPIYLREGTHAYKFIVDGDWITDPDNPVVRPDGDGNFNSFMGIGDTLVFSLRGFTEAREVTLAGSFNGWNPGELYMEKTPTGWQIPYVLAPGNYGYKYIVDGQWMPDPDIPFTSGKGDYVNSFVSFKPNYVFMLNDYPDAKEVMVTGSFNGWIYDGYRMAKNNDTWIIPLFLPPGKYTYKFIVDGDWILDPNNPLWEDNEYGTGNSVIWI
ncbi:MAG: hypothetical protein K8R53_13010, partial [Bacteroidales bacterium]|nr:hypothetical protein [Bacteroidales bacterium]